MRISQGIEGQIEIRGFRKSVLPALCGCLFLLLGVLNSQSTAADQDSPYADGLKVRVAAISFVPVKFDLAGNADRLGACSPG